MPSPSRQSVYMYKEGYIFFFNQDFYFPLFSCLPMFSLSGNTVVSKDLGHS